MDGTSEVPFHLVANTIWPTSERTLPEVDECGSNVGHRVRFWAIAYDKLRPLKKRHALSSRNPESRLPDLLDILSEIKH